MRERPGTHGEGERRFELRDRLGEGTFGVVWRAHDLELGAPLALKVLRHPRGADLSGLKREFRLLRHLRHPNLVQLYELVEVDGRAALTMELLDGAPLDAPDAGRRAEPRDVAVQLLRGLDALHDVGVVHGDVKPSNLVRCGSGRLVLLDFGFARHLGEPRDAGFTGTLRYAAPEVLWRGRSGPAADLFAAAASLIEVFVGARGGLPWSTRSQQRRGAASREALEARFGAPLSELLLELLAADPAARPTAKDALARLGEPVRAGVRAPFVGRDAPFERVRRHRAEAAGRYAEIHVTGPPGIGKSRFCEELAHAWRREGVRVLRSRCDPVEALRFQGLDGIVDQVASLAERESLLEGLSERQRDALARGFPVLGDALPRAGRGDAGRGALVRALRHLFAELARRGPLVLWVDDAQWGDEDSAALLGDALREGPIPLTLLLSYRAGDALPPFVRRCAAEGAPRHREPLGPLPPRAGRALIRGLAPTLDARAAEALLAPLEGNPFLIARALGDEPAADAAPGSTRAALLRLVAVCRSPAPMDVLVAAHPAEDAARELFALCHEGTLEAHGRAGVTFSHDLLRTRLLEGVDEGARRATARSLASVWAASPSLDPGRVAQLFFEGGDAPRAARWALRAAAAAQDALAFARAAEMYALAARADPATIAETGERWGECLALAGRPTAAADRLLASRAHVADPGTRRRLRAAAANVLISSGNLARGVALVDETLAELGTRRPRTRARTLLRFLWERGRLAGWPGRRSRVPPAEACDALHSLASVYGVLDTVTGAIFQTRTLRLARRLGPSPQLLRAVANERSYEGISRGRGGRWLALDRELTALERAVDDRDARAYATVLRGYEAFMTAHFAEAREHFARATRAYAALGGARWERSVAQSHALLVEIFLDDLPRLRRELPELREAFLAREDYLNATLLELGAGFFVELAEDRPERARERLEEAMAPWGDIVAPAFEFLYFRGRTLVDLYRGEPGELARHEARLARSRWALGAEAVTVELEWYRALARGAAHGRRHARRIRRVGTPLAPGLTQALFAWEALARGRDAEAAAHAERARQGFREAGLVGHARTWAWIQHRRGWSRDAPSPERGIRNLEAWARMHTPVDLWR